MNVERYRGPIRNWWVPVLLGVMFLVVGVVVFFHPGTSYLTLAVMFGIGVIISGIFDLYVGASTHVQSGRGWMIAAGVIEILLGILMLFPQISGLVLPFMLAFWLMFRGFTLIGVSSDMMSYGIKGPGWVIALAVLLIIAAFIVLFNPVVGVGVIVIFLGISLLLLGIAMIVLGIDLYSLRKHLMN